MVSLGVCEGKSSSLVNTAVSGGFHSACANVGRYLDMHPIFSQMTKLRFGKEKQLDRASGCGSLKSLFWGGGFVSVSCRAPG